MSNDTPELLVLGSVGKQDDQAVSMKHGSKHHPFMASAVPDLTLINDEL